MSDQQNSESTPVVSVIMPCYNQGQYVDEAVDSVLRQTFQSFEIIVINDGSTDLFTLERLKSFDKPKTRVLHTDNQGVATARNRGIQEARGRYVLPLDADDCITSFYLEKAVPILDSQQDVGIVYGQGELFGEQSGVWNLPDYQFPEILLTNVIFNSALFRRADWQLVGGYRSNMIYGLEDYDFWLYLIEIGRKVVRLPEVVYLYRQRSDSRNHNIQMQFEQHVECYTQLFRNHMKLYADNIDILFRRYMTSHANEHQYRAQIAYLTEELQQTQVQFQQIQVQLQQTQAQLQQAQAQLQQAQAQAHQIQAQLERTHEEAVTAQVTIAAMESSKFWKLRNAWLSFKNAIGL